MKINVKRYTYVFAILVSMKHTHIGKHIKCTQYSTSSTKRMTVKLLTLEFYFVRDTCVSKILQMNGPIWLLYLLIFLSDTVIFPGQYLLPAKVNLAIIQVIHTYQCQAETITLSLHLFFAISLFKIFFLM